MSKEKPWWFPEVTDAKWCKEMRPDYLNEVDWDEDKIRNWYAFGRKYVTWWDDLNDARDQYEALADAYLKLLEKHKKLKKDYKYFAQDSNA